MISRSVWYEVVLGVRLTYSFNQEKETLGVTTIAIAHFKIHGNY